MSDLVVWFDGACPLCRQEIALMRRLDRRHAITFVDVAAPGSAATDCPIDRAALLARFHALEHGRLVSGAAAFAAMWRCIPVLRPFGSRRTHPAVLSVLEFLYGRFLRVRPRIQRAMRMWEGRTVA